MYERCPLSLHSISKYSSITIRRHGVLHTNQSHTYRWRHGCTAIGLYDVRLFTLPEVFPDQFLHDTWCLAGIKSGFTHLRKCLSAKAFSVNVNFRCSFWKFKPFLFVSDPNTTYVRVKGLTIYEAMLRFILTLINSGTQLQWDGSPRHAWNATSHLDILRRLPAMKTLNCKDLYFPRIRIRIEHVHSQCRGGTHPPARPQAHTHTRTHKSIYNFNYPLSMNKTD